MRLDTMLRPVVDDAAQSIAYGDGQIDHADIMAWFDTLTVEDLQEIFMGAMQDTILAHNAEIIARSLERA